MVEDILRSVHGYGFRKVLVLNGHGGNLPARGRVYEVVNALPDLQVRWYDWWLSPSVEAVARSHELRPAHANWLEAFPFTRVSDLPEGSKPPPKVKGLLNARQAREVYGDGAFGGPYTAPAEVMEALFQAALEDVLHLLSFA